MKVKFGNMTINQTIEVCKEHYRGVCNGCPLNDDRFNCIAFIPPYTTKLCDLQEREIDLPDEEDKDSGICPYPNCHYKQDHYRCLECDSRYKETDKFDSIINDLKNGVQPQINTDSQLPEGCREVH